jgi:hypothetical protein
VDWNDCNLGNKHFDRPCEFGGFVSSTFGMFLIAWFTLLTALPAIKKQSINLKSKWVGGVIVAFGGYFFFSILVYFVSGGFAAHRSAWCELIVPHNPYAWCVIFLFTGLHLLFRFRKNLN